MTNCVLCGHPHYDGTTNDAAGAPGYASCFCGCFGQDPMTLDEFVPPYITTLVRSGGLWHAAPRDTYDNGTGRTLCGHVGFADHLHDGKPVAAATDVRQDSQITECIRCHNAMTRAAVGELRPVPGPLATAASAR